MEILMWIALAGGLAAVLKVLPETLIDWFERIEHTRETGFGRNRPTPVPAHTIERLARQRRHRH